MFSKNDNKQQEKWILRTHESLNYNKVTDRLMGIVGRICFPLIIVAERSLFLFWKITRSASTLYIRQTYKIKVASVALVITIEPLEPSQTWLLQSCCDAIQCRFLHNIQLKQIARDFCTDKWNLLTIHSYFKVLELRFVHNYVAWLHRFTFSVINAICTYLYLRQTCL